MATIHFEQSDFEIFSIPGLAPRMQAIQQQIQPKFIELGSDIADFLTTLVGEPMHIHIAKHARRTVHPPEKTWMAWAANKRGYKPYPHFQFGIDEQALSIWFAIFSECKRKQAIASKLHSQLNKIWSTIPSHFLFSEDHTRDEQIHLADLGQAGMEENLNRIQQVKKAEFLCGIRIPKQECEQLMPENLVAKLTETFTKLQLLYRLSVE